MQTVTVNASSSYPVHIGSGLLRESGKLIAAVTAARKCVVVTDSTVDQVADIALQARLRSSAEGAIFIIFLLYHVYTQPAP